MNAELINRVNSQLPSIMKDAFQRISFGLQAFILSNMNIGGGVVNKGSFNTFTTSKSSKLNIMSGDLAKSFSPREKTNVFNIKQSGGDFELEYGSNLPYANIHEKGGFIRTKGKMEGFFWYKFRETKNPFMRALALRVRHFGGVNMPARPYFEMGLQKYETSNNGFINDLNYILQQINKLDS